MSFEALGLQPALVSALRERGITQPSPVQTAAIPAVLAGRDLLAMAPTGSGKTLAYGLPLLQWLCRQNSVRPSNATRSLILVPTRELAVQVGESLRRMANRLTQDIRISVVFGGVSINPQMMALRGGTDVLVATPGRLLDLVSKKAVSLHSAQWLVLDEADRLLDLGFSEELHALLAQLPAQRQNLLLSATFPADVQTLAQGLLYEPARLEIQASPSQASAIRQRAVQVDSPRRAQLLRHLLNTDLPGQILVFVASKYGAEILADKLRKGGFAAEPFHASLSQGKRQQVLADFKAGRIRAMVATDVAARGLDISGLPAVVNFDLPRSATDYTHRIGRTGRAVAEGLALSLVSADTLAHFQLIQRRHGLQLNLETVSGFEPTETAAPVASTGGIKGKRPSKKDKLRAAAAAHQP